MRDERDGVWLEIDTSGGEYWYEYGNGNQIPPKLFDAPDRIDH